MIAIDTNLLVYAAHRGAPEHLRAKAALQRVRMDSRGWGITGATALEFWSVTTGSAGGATLASVDEAGIFLASLFRSGAQLWGGDPVLYLAALSLARDMHISGRRIFDLAIGVVALKHGAQEIWTHDRKFAAPAGLAVVDPL